VKARRLELGIATKEEAARLTAEGDSRGFSVQTWTSIEKAKITNRRPSNLEALCRVLGWRPGSIEAILRGGDPIPAEVDIRDLKSQEDRFEALAQHLEAALQILDVLRSNTGSQAER
jgi:hypothetical protein